MISALSIRGAMLADPKRLLKRHPEYGAWIVIAAAWAVLLTLAIRHGVGHVLSDAMPGMSMQRHMGSLSGMAAMPGMTMADMPGMRRSSAGDQSLWAHLLVAWVPYWLAMTTVMMGPAALDGIRHTAVNSLRWRRRRAMVEYCLGYLVVWAAFGAAALNLANLVPSLAGTRALAVVLVTAAAWQLSSLKLRFLRRCHRNLPLPPKGWVAERRAFEFGVRNGIGCVGSCWCLMLIMLVAPSSGLLWMAGLCAIATAERILPRPRRTSRQVACLLAIGGVASLAVAFA